MGNAGARPQQVLNCVNSPEDPNANATSISAGAAAWLSWLSAPWTYRLFPRCRGGAARLRRHPAYPSASAGQFRVRPSRGTGQGAQAAPLPHLRPDRSQHGRSRRPVSHYPPRSRTPGQVPRHRGNAAPWHGRRSRHTGWERTAVGSGSPLLAQRTDGPRSRNQATRHHRRPAGCQVLLLRGRPANRRTPFLARSLRPVPSGRQRWARFAGFRDMGPFLWERACRPF